MPNKIHVLLYYISQVINKMLYSGSSDHTGRAWVTEFGDCTRIYKGHKHTVSVIKMKEGLGKGFLTLIMYAQFDMAL